MSRVSERLNSANYDTTATDEAVDLFAETAAKARSGPRLKFVKGIFLVGDDVIAAGTELVVLAGDAARAWTRFEAGRFTEQKIYRLADGKRPPERDELPDPPSTWADGKDGKPKDPWCLQWLIPMILLERDECVIWTADSVGGNQASEALIAAYTPFRNSGQVPIVALKVRVYDHPTYGRTQNPVLKVVRWTTASTVAPAPMLTSEPAAIAGPDHGDGGNGVDLGDTFGDIDSNNGL